MEGGDEGDFLVPRDPGGRHAGHEGTVGVDDPEAAPENLPQKDWVHLGNACHIRCPEGNLDGQIVQYLVFLVTVVGSGVPGGDDADAADFFLHPAGIILHADGDSVHDRRKTFVKKTDV